MQVLGGGVDDVHQKYLQQRLNLGPQVGIGPVAVEVGIGLQHVEVGIHGLFLVGVLIAQPQVFQWRPVAAQRFEVSAVFRVKAVLLDAAKQILSVLQSPLVAAGRVIFAQPVQRKSQGVNLLFGVQRLPRVIH